MKRWGNVGINIVRGAATPLYSVVLSIVVVRCSEAEVWGKFVQSLILIGLAAQILNWGFRDLLLRQFAATPATLTKQFTDNLFTRALLLPLLFLALRFFADSTAEWLWLSTWLLFTFLYLSFEVLIIYKRAFLSQFIADTLGFLVPILALFFFNTDSLTAASLLHWFVAGVVLKWLLLAIAFRKEFNFTNPPQLTFSFFVNAFPFFLIGLNGMLLSKADLYVTSLYVSADDLGKYQVCMTFFIYLQALAGFTTMPFLKSMFRINEHSYGQLSKMIRWFGVIACLTGTPLIYFFVVYGYGFEISIRIFVLGALAAFPVFYYTPNIIMLYRKEKEQKLMWVNLFAALFSAAVTWLLLPKTNIQAGFIAVALTQWALLIFYSQQKPTTEDG